MPLSTVTEILKSTSQSTILVFIACKYWARFTADGRKKYSFTTVAWCKVITCKFCSIANYSSLSTSALCLHFTKYWFYCALACAKEKYRILDSRTCYMVKIISQPKPNPNKPRTIPFQWGWMSRNLSILECRSISGLFRETIDTSISDLKPHK